MRFAIAHENNFKNRPKSVFKYLNNAEMKKGTQKKNTRTHYIVQNTQTIVYIFGNWMENIASTNECAFAFQHLQFVISLDNKKNTKGAVPIISCEFKMYSTIVVDLNHLVSSLVFFLLIHGVFVVLVCLGFFFCLLSFGVAIYFYSVIFAHDYIIAIISFVCSRFCRVSLTFRKCEHLVRDNDINVVFLRQYTHSHI